MTKDEFDAQLLRDLSLAYAELDVIQPEILQIDDEIHKLESKLMLANQTKEQAQARVDLLEDRVRNMLRYSAPSTVDKLQRLLQSKIGKAIDSRFVADLVREANELGAERVKVYVNRSNGAVEMQAEINGQDYMFEIAPDGLVMHKEITR